jgi:hypothetical protein
MKLSHKEKNDIPPSLGSSDQLTENQVKTVINEWSLERHQDSQVIAPDHARVHDVAEALNISDSEVERLLEKGAQSEVIDDQTTKPASPRKIQIVPILIASLAIIAFLFNYEFWPGTADHPQFAIESVSVHAPTKLEKNYPGENAWVDVTYRYHPTSIRRMIYGPIEFPAAAEPTLVDQLGKSYTIFKDSSGASWGMSIGEKYKISNSLYHEGFGFPYNKEMGTQLQIIEYILVDDQNEQLEIPIDMSNFNPGK